MDFKKLIAYQEGFDLAMSIFEIGKTFPTEETYSFTDQIGRSSCLVCANISEAYPKRIYPKHFIRKLTDADGENSETISWLNFALACKYIAIKDFAKFEKEGIEIGKLINYMINNPEKFSVKDK